MMTEFEYEKILNKEGKAEVRITRCYGYENRIIVPERIGGDPVTEAGPYLFSVWKEDPGDEERHPVSGDQVQEVYLPDSVRKIGAYAFYGCTSLTGLSFSDALEDLGAGIFTGCRPGAIEVRFLKGQASCLKELTGEIRHKLLTKCHYDNGTAALIFPEYYEEAVENTPARLLETRFHGSGGNYRQCFQGKEINYREYDSLFNLAAAQESKETAAQLALYRLRYPYQLSEDAKESYSKYLTVHLEVLLPGMLDKEETDVFYFLAKEGIWSWDTIDKAVAMAAERQNAVAQSCLMDVKHTYFKKKQKKYEL